MNLSCKEILPGIRVFRFYRLPFTVYRTVDSTGTPSTYMQLNICDSVAALGVGPMGTVEIAKMQRLQEALQQLATLTHNIIDFVDSKSWLAVSL